VGTVISPFFLPNRRIPLAVSTVLLVSSKRYCTESVKENTMLFNNTGCQNIGADDLIEKIEAGEDFLLLDVRTPQEHAAQTITGSYLLPLQELGYRIGELPKDKEIVVYCRVGNRSAYACSYLSRMGYKVKNLEGGIMTWNLFENVSMTRAS
jgi:phage shock protein E